MTRRRTRSSTSSTSFITPFDQKDIYNLASSLDDIMDFMEEAVDLVILYNVEELPQGRRAADRGAGSAAADLTAEAMPHLRTMKNLTEYWIEVNRWNQADKIHRKLLAHLQRVVRRHRGAEAQGDRGCARGGRRRVRARREHGGDHRRQGVLTCPWTPVPALVVIIAVALSTTPNGFHDAANAIAIGSPPGADPTRAAAGRRDEPGRRAAVAAGWPRPSARAIIDHRTATAGSGC